MRGVGYVYHVGRSQAVPDRTQEVQCGIEELNCNLVLVMPRMSLRGRSDRLNCTSVLQLFGPRGINQPII